MWMQVSEVLGFPMKDLGEIHAQIKTAGRKVTSTEQFIDSTLSR